MCVTGLNCRSTFVLPVVYILILYPHYSPNMTDLYSPWIKASRMFSDLTPLSTEPRYTLCALRCPPCADFASHHIVTWLPLCHLDTEMPSFGVPAEMTDGVVYPGRTFSADHHSEICWWNNNINTLFSRLWRKTTPEPRHTYFRISQKKKKKENRKIPRPKI